MITSQLAKLFEELNFQVGCARRVEKIFGEHKRPSQHQMSVFTGAGGNISAPYKCNFYASCSRIWLPPPPPKPPIISLNYCALVTNHFYATLLRNRILKVRESFLQSFGQSCRVLMFARLDRKLKMSSKSWNKFSPLDFPAFQPTRWQEGGKLTLRKMSQDSVGLQILALSLSNL